jgi:hypothetical protein
MNRDPGATPALAASAELKRAVVDHYERQLERFGPTAQGMDWKDEASQRLRFQILCGVCDMNALGVHEVACGAGHLSDYLEQQGIRPASYSGSAASPAMVEVARRLHPRGCFEERDILAEPESERHDIVLCSGLFHVKLDASDVEWEGFVRASVRRMYAMCRVAIAFNVMSDQVDTRSEQLYYPDTASMFQFCRRELSRYVCVRHDYPLYETTFYVYRDPSK